MHLQILTGEVTSSRLNSSRDITDQLLLRANVGPQADTDGVIVLTDRNHGSIELYSESCEGSEEKRERGRGKNKEVGREIVWERGRGREREGWREGGEGQRSGERVRGREEEPERDPCVRHSFQHFSNLIPRPHYNKLCIITSKFKMFLNISRD